MARDLQAAVIAVAAAFLLAISPATSAAGDGTRSELDGKPIGPAQARDLSCHDFNFPVLTCFRTSEELEAAAALRTRQDPTAGEGAVSASSSGYLIVYEHGGYGGAARAISRDYSYLGDIGWNDRISSFRSYGAVGRFNEHAPSGGFSYWFHSTTQVSYVGDAYNDRFSAVYLD